MPDLDLPGWAVDLIDAAGTAGEDIPAALALANDYGTHFPLPGGGRTAVRWQILAGVARVNLTVARVVEAHTDALAILAESGANVVDVPGTYGVFAAEAPNGRLEAQIAGDRVVLNGVKPWCSLGGALDHALVTAHIGHQRQLFKVDLRDPTVRADPPERWVARGLRRVTSGPVQFDNTPAEPVGGPGWYLSRPGFAWGGIGVAACWHGGAQGIADTVRHTSARRTGEVNALHVGAIDAALFGAASALMAASRHVDSGDRGAEVLALRARAVVADAVERVLHQAGHALGPAPLAFDDDHATRVADLQLYVRQHHGERDLAVLGAAVLTDSDA